MSDLAAIVAEAPTRICLFGGGTDVNPYAAEEGGAIVNVAIDLRHRVTIHPREDDEVLVSALGELRRFGRGELAGLTFGEDPRFDLLRAILRRFADRLPGGLALVVESDVGDGCGLGTSGSAGVAAVAALGRYCGEQPAAPGALARLAFELETEELGWAGGKQDQWAAAFGGLCLTRYGPGEDVSVRPLACDDAALARLRRWLLLVHLGGRRASAGLQVSLQRGMREGAARRAALDELRQVALEAAPLVEAGELEVAGALAHRGWRAKKRSNPAVSSPRIDEVYAAAREAGALGGKLIGAGGAGYLYLLCPPQAQPEVRRALGQLAAPVVDRFAFDLTGARVAALNG